MDLISIVIPAYNEADVLPSSVATVVAGLRERERSFELLVVENGSSDDTWAIAQRCEAEHDEVRALRIDQPNYGLALREGFLQARGEIVSNFDADYYDLAFLDRALVLLEGPDAPVIVVGTKRGEGANDTRPLPRRLVTFIFSTILRIGFGLSVSDTHGMKAMRRTPLIGLVEICRFGTDLFDTELILRAERAGLATAEIPVVVEELRPSRTSILRRVPRSLLGLVRLRVALWRDHV